MFAGFDAGRQDVDLIRALDAAGVCVSLNSDDPTEFEGGYLTNMLILFQEASGYSKSDMTRLIRNAFDAIWLPQAEKDVYSDELRKYAVENAVEWR